MDTSTLINRMIRASKLEIDFYREVEADTSLNQEALLVVIITAIASGFGGLFSALFGQGIILAVLALIASVVLGVIGYYVWVYVTLFVGKNLYGATADVGELQRTLGYATAPRILGIFSFIPCLGALISLISAIWSLVAGIYAVREALDFDTTQAVITVIIGWLIVMVLTFMVLSVVGLGALGAGVLAGGLG